MSYKSKYTGKQVDDLLTRIEAGDLDITIDQELSLESTNAISNSAVTNAIGELPNTEGYYPNMSVGMSNNLVGRGDVQDAQINFRPSAGADNISDAAARVERIKGNSVVWNQLFNGITSATKNGVTLINNGNGSYTVYTDSAGATADTTFASGAVTGLAGHKRLALGAPSGSSNTTYYLFDPWSGAGVYEQGYIYSTSQNTMQYNIVVKAGVVITVPIVFRPQYIDLTKMFSAGNEPTTVEEYHQRKPMNIEDEFAYNEGELIDMKVNSLISTSDNAYDYVRGYARVIGGHTYDCTYGTAFVDEVYFSTNKDNIVAEENAMASGNGKYTFPSDGYAVPYTMNGDVREYCVCLQHTYTKPHPPYQQVVKDLSFIGEAFPEGMRSAGSAYDEIRFNHTKKMWEKITRIGVVDLGSLIWGGSTQTACSNAFRAMFNVDAVNSVSFSTRYQQSAYTASAWIPNTYPNTTNIFNGYIGVNAPDYTDVTTFKQAMQGVLLYYELATPIVEEIALSLNFNLDYFAWDFGTEEAIASVPSAPFRADINYEPNAVDDLRWAVSEIRSLRAELAQLQSAQTSETNLTE